MDSIKQSNPALYAQIPQETINELLNEDLLRHGGTYAKAVKDGVEVYVNSAITKLIVWSGVSLSSIYIVPILTAIGIGATAASTIASVVGYAIVDVAGKATDLGFHATVKLEVGIWRVTNWGYQ